MNIEQPSYREDLRNKEHQKMPSLHLEVECIEANMIVSLNKKMHVTIMCMINSPFSSATLCVSDMVW